MYLEYYMAFIKAQKIVCDETGRIISSSASIVDAIYVQTGTRAHSRQQVREKLGKVLYLSENRKSGIFLSPTRGLVEYDAPSDSFSSVKKDDSRINGEILFPQTEIHTVFGDAYLFLQFLEKCGLLSVLRSVFPKGEDYERILSHILHSILRDGSRISCDNFIQKSFASYLFPNVPVSSLHSDTRFFSMLGDDHVKVSFFQTFVSAMQKKEPDFGRGCYVDSTPLPNDIDDNPFNALCCHGVASSEVMPRLILVLDEKSGLPVWYDIIPGNVLDINTVMSVVNDVADSLGIEIESLMLDAGYVSKELVGAFHIGTEKTIIGRMPARKGYPYKTLYWEVKDLIGKGKGPADGIYLDLLPLSKWTDQTVRGKILHDIINTICLLELRKKLLPSGKSVSEIIGRCQSLMCFRNNKGIVTVETPSKQVKESYKLFHTDVPDHVDLDKFRETIMNAKM